MRYGDSGGGRDRGGGSSSQNSGFFLFPPDTGHLISILSFKLKTGHLQPGMQSVSFQHPPDRFSPRGGRREQTGERGG